MLLWFYKGENRVVEISINSFAWERCLRHHFVLFRGIYKSRRLVLYQQINKLPLVSLRSLALFYIGVAQEGPVKQLELQKELMGGLEVRREPLVKVALCEGHICTDRQIRYSILVFFSLLRWGIPQNNMNIMNVKVMINHDKPLFSDKPIRSYVCAF